MSQLSGEDESRTGSDREFCFYRGNLVSVRGQFFQSKSAAEVRLVDNSLVHLCFPF